MFYSIYQYILLKSRSQFSSPRVEKVLVFCYKKFKAYKKKSSVYFSNILIDVQNLCGKRDAWASQHKGRRHPLLYNFWASLFT